MEMGYYLIETLEHGTFRTRYLTPKTADNFLKKGRGKDCCF